ncbi:hypothetical protein [Lentilactobacillus hilgardii]|uniref:hypothetical protein n=1 Tax=Lentilactobacillus hilgardii TaxID=1588 RepID=UPI00019C4C17|nr:hypothetical protein [Lentilactobacillus hilgardii]EEI21192.1 hypothetical protein HMPREF0497_0005 [Lentilactobacillus buchneri ATCC 11577]MCT3397276.1 hypothetical protein [Lentilactobacillus hilgardii]
MIKEPGQKNQALVIITDIKTVTELADRRRARRYKTIKKSVHILFGILIPKKWLNMNSLWPIKLLEDNLIQEMC